MRIFAQICLLGLCLGVAAQETTPKTSTTKEAGSEEASKIVKQLFSGMKSPSPVIPPLVESIEKELKEKEVTWNPTGDGKSRDDVRMATVSKVDQKLFGASANRSNQGPDKTNPPEVEPLVEVEDPVIPGVLIEPRGEFNRGGSGSDSVTASSKGNSGAENYASSPLSGAGHSISSTRVQSVEQAAVKNKPFAKLFTKSNSGKKSKPGPLFKGRGGLFKKLRAKKASEEVSVEK